MCNCFEIQAYITTFDMSFNISLKAWLIVFLADKVLGFINTKMLYQKVVIVLTDKLYLNNFRYKR